MRDQIIMAMAAKVKKKSVLYDSLMKCTKDSMMAIGDVISDAKRHPRYCFYQCSEFVNALFPYFLH